MYTLTKLDLTSVALYSFLMILLFSLIFIIPFGLLFMALQNFILDSGFSHAESDIIYPIFGWAFIIGMPIFYSVLGTIINVLIAIVYNLVSKKFGGIKFSLNKIVGEISVTHE
jgi:hypothetical protein